jgi:microcystin-dependent protein
VGIGTSSPDGKLRIESSGASNGTVASKTSLQLSTSNISSGSASTRIQWTYGALSNGTKSWIEGGVYGTDYLAFGYGSNEQMRINSSGNVSIGTASSYGKLLVYGDAVNFSPTADTSNNGIGACVFGQSVATATSSVARLYLTGNHADHAGTLDLRSGAVIGSSINMYAVSGTKTVYFNTNSDSYINGGNVGIGTNAPAYKLDVRGSANVGALTTSGTVTLGSNTNVKITGGSSGQYLQTDGSGNLSYVTVQGVPVASIIMYGANTAPSGWLVCDGTAVSRSTYSGLFAVVSNVFGIGDNSTTFNLPDFRGRSPHGVDASQSITIGGTSAGKINISYQNSSGTGTTGTGTTGTSTTGTSATAITATTSNASTTVASATSTGTTAGGSGSIPAATYSTGSGTGTIPAATYSTGTGTTAGGTTAGGTSGTGTTAGGTTGTGTTGSGGPTTHTLTTIAYQLPVLVKDQSPNSLVSGVTDHTAHTHTIPGLAVPGLSVPGLSIPGLSVPGLSVPALSIPAMNVSVPGLTIPAITTTIPGLSIPALTIPSLTVNTHTHNVPALTIPGLSIPGLSIPGLSVPALTVTHPATIVQFIIKT